MTKKEQEIMQGLAEACGHVTMLVQIEWPCSAETAKA
jgi:hypothetical protein